VAKTERVTVTLPAELVGSIDRMVKNRSRFVTEAVERELTRRRHEALRRSLEHPHPDAAELADAGLRDWAASMSAADADLVDASSGTAVRWVEGQGWIEEST
jgi:Arc/MetJ-type ribon-helix-helix transcriptional regulator